MRRHAKAIVAISALLLTLALGATVAGAVAPSVTIEAASEVSYATAKAKGTVDPGDHEASYHFEAATEADFSNVSAFAGFGSLPEGAGSTPVEADFGELKPGTAYHLRLVGENTEGERSEAVAASTFTTEAVAAPTALVGPVTAVTGTSAHFSGSVNPNAPEAAPTSPQVEAGFGLKWRFACTPSCPGGEGSQVIAADDSSHTVEADVTGLDPNTDYEVRLVAKNAGDPVEAGPQAFHTTAIGPAVIALPVGPVTETTAVIGGKVDPSNSPTTYYMEYARQPDFSGAVSLPSSQNASAGSGSSPVSVSALAQGLAPNSGYFYRVVADNQVGPPMVGAAHSFHTLDPDAAGPPCPNIEFRSGASARLAECRAYEKVTPADKNGGDAFTGTVLDDDHIYFRTSTAFLSDDPFFASVGKYLASRSQDNWDLRPGFVGPNSSIADFNENFSQEIVTQVLAAPLLPVDTDSAQDVYSRSASGLNLVSIGSLGGNAPDAAHYAGQSADGSHILFQTPEHLEPADPAAGPGARTSGYQLYERVGAETRVVGLDSSENLINDGGAVLGDGATNAGAPSGSSNAISRDGTHIFFESPDPSTFGNTQLYVRINGEDTVQVSSSQCDRVAPPCGSAQSVTFQGADKNGSRVFFTTTGQLTDDDTDELNDLYRYELATHQLARISQFQNPTGCQDGSGFPTTCGITSDAGVVAVADDGRRVYFTGRGIAASGGSSREQNLYLYDDRVDATRLVANVSESVPLYSQGLLMPSPTASATSDGATVVFESNAQLTSFDNAGLVEIYRYQVATDEINCVSCNSANAVPLQKNGTSAEIQNARKGTPFGDPGSPAAGSKPNLMVSDDGNTVVFLSVDSLVSRDTNELYDVYEWHNGEFSILTLGTSSNNSMLAGISSSGHSIFFATYDQLVPQDTDFQSDVYDARINGGLPRDQAEASMPSCQGSACRGQGSHSPADAAATTNSFIGSGNAQPKRHHKKQKKHHRKRPHKRQAKNKRGSR